MLDPLRSFEWHDLPVESLTFSEGAIRLVVTPFRDDSQEYETYELLLTDATRLKLSIEGDMDFKNLKDLEVFDFDSTVRENRLSGELTILPGDGGVWKIGFADAAWRLKKMAGHVGASDGDKS